jgi:predicted phosphodiesterase
MSIAIIGDIHGREKYKEIIDDAMSKARKVILLGDYIDPYPISEKTPDTKSKYSFMYNKEYIYPKFEDTIKILDDIIQIKKSNLNKIILLIGNHDAHYLFDDIEISSRYDSKNATKIKSIYKNNFDLFQYAFQTKNKLFTHAGISNGWYNTHSSILKDFGLNDDKSNFMEVFDNISKSRYNYILNIVSYIRGGDSLYGGITWADFDETYKNNLDGFDQYVGHSKVKNIITMTNENGTITYCDVLNNTYTNISDYYKIIQS